jgi:hypothetical protein
VLAAIKAFRWRFDPRWTRGLAALIPLVRGGLR